MKSEIIKNYSLNNFNSSYLLVKLPGHIITNTNYKELLILDNHLNKIKTVKPPLQEMIIHYTYYHHDKEQVLFQLDDEDSSMLLFNIKNCQFKLIKSPELSYGGLSTDYIWTNNYFYTIIGWDDKNLLEIDTATLSVQLYPFEDLYTQAPELAQKIEIMKRFHCNREIPGTQFFGVLDYDNTKTIEIRNFQGELARAISIENELEKELYNKNGRIHAEKIPYEIIYQDDWFIVIWEKKIIVISPSNNRITLYLNEPCMFFMPARFIKTTKKSAYFVALVSAETCKLQLYHVEDN